MTGTTKNGATVEIRCPKCGGTEAFRYLEDIVNHRNVVGFNEHGVLRIDGCYETGEGYDDGEHRRLECRNTETQCHRHDLPPDHVHGFLCYGTCGHEFPIPDGIEIDFV